MRFAHPQLLWLLWLLPVLGLLLWTARGAARRRAQELVQEPLLETMASSVSESRRTWRALLRFCALALLVLAAARPQFGASEVEVKQTGIDLVVALDISRSMLADDIQPSRLVRAKAEIGDLVESLRGDRVGLVFFAGAAFPQCPLTVDYAAARLFLSQADPSMIAAQGTDIATALRTALELFDEEKGRYRVILLVTDGEDFAGGLEQIRDELHQKGVLLYAVGMGTAAGAPVPDFDASGHKKGFVRDREGNVVMSHLEEAPLVELTQVTGGVYARASARGLDLDRLLAELGTIEGREYAAQRVTSYRERYLWPLLGALGLLVLESLLHDRRRRA